MNGTGLVGFSPLELLALEFILRQFNRKIYVLVLNFKPLKVFIMNDIYKKMMQQQTDILNKISSPMTIGNLMGPAPGIFQMAKAGERSIAKQLHHYHAPTFTMIKPPKVGFSNISSFAMIKPPKVESPSTSISSVYITAMNMAIKESSIFDCFKFPQIGIANMALDRPTLIHHPDISQNLLKSLSYLEEHARRMSIAAIGRDDLDITAFSAIDAVETQFKFFQQNTTVEESFSKTTLYGFLNQFSGLDLDDFETEEDWHNALIEKIRIFLKQCFETIQKHWHKLNIVSVFGNLTVGIISSIMATIIINPPVSQQDIKEPVSQQDIEEIVQTQIEKKFEEKDQRLAEQIGNIITDEFEKYHNSSTEYELPSSEAQVLYCTINDVEVKSEPSATASSITALAKNERIEAVKTQNDEWLQIEFYDYIQLKTRKGWLQTNDVEPLLSRTKQDANPIDEVVTPGTQRLAEASDCIHNRYAKTF